MEFFILGRAIFVKALLGSCRDLAAILRKDMEALVAELVDAQDLKSCLPKGEYGFDSRLGHKGPSTKVEGPLHFSSVVSVEGAGAFG